MRLSSQEAITKLRSQLRFDPTAIQLLGASTGDVVPAEAGKPEVNTRAGGAQLEVNTQSTAPVQGEGSLMVLRFKALSPRPSTSVAAMLSVIGSTGAAVGNGAATPLNISIQ